MSSLLKTSAVLAALCLSACATSSVPDRLVEGRTPTEHFKATAVPQAESLALAVHAQGLSSNQADALIAYLDGWRDAEGGAITIQAPVAGADTSSAYRAAEAARSFLLGQGVSPSLIIMAGYDADPQAGAPVRIAYTRYQAVVPRCGQQWTNIAHSARNEVQPNFGCAITANMAAQIANPADLVRPADLGPADAQRRIYTLDKYRRGEVTSSAADDQAKGSVSSVAK
ncbi:CpaD family pilus assembly protein [Phenylobacterium sp.]|uniref:CpaD family pilus assembly protein n=1 Tax=Phenylobacterium sp. TaxID=1871053 RepID=UPI00271B01AD|nr:CpaD family pilus assembly protein [Phenylobacterium sp.]MDO8800491.1 CpaD family pilus assembly protein [Phenylobacterium sp.]